MGVDFYNCNSCEVIYPDCGPCGYTECCELSLCGKCDDLTETFWYNGKLRCDNCWPPSTEPITDKTLLDFALEKLKMKKSDLKQELIDSDPSKYTYKSFVYECNENHDCGSSACNNINHLTWQQKYEKYSIEDAKGICCKTWMPDDKDQWCDACSKKKK